MQDPTTVRGSEQIQRRRRPSENVFQWMKNLHFNCLKQNLLSLRLLFVQVVLKRTPAVNMANKESEIKAQRAY